VVICKISTKNTENLSPNFFLQIYRNTDGWCERAQWKNSF
jgi:hypothetical protein